MHCWRTYHRVNFRLSRVRWYTILVGIFSVSSVTQVDSHRDSLYSSHKLALDLLCYEVKPFYSCLILFLLFRSGLLQLLLYFQSLSLVSESLVDKIAQLFECYLVELL